MAAVLIFLLLVLDQPAQVRRREVAAGLQEAAPGAGAWRGLCVAGLHRPALGFLGWALTPPLAHRPGSRAGLIGREREGVALEVLPLMVALA